MSRLKINVLLGHRVGGGGVPVYCRRLLGAKTRPARGDDGNLDLPCARTQRRAHRLLDRAVSGRQAIFPCNCSTWPCPKNSSTAIWRSLDPHRENFLQTDIDEFAHYRTNLDVLTIGGRGRADLTPAYEIFGRFLERLTQHTDYVNKLLKHDRFKFDTDERIMLDRRHAQYPKDMTEAEELWQPAVAL